MALAIYLETGAKRVFASAIAWPGWSRGGRDEDGAVAALVAYGGRYADAIGQWAARLDIPADSADIDVVARLAGGSGTDFGVPSRPGPGDEDAVDAAEADRLAGILQACWATFDGRVTAAAGVELTKGPRGGGRDLDKIVGHVWEADIAYHQSLGHPYRVPKDESPRDDTPRLRQSALAALRSRVAGEPLPPSKRTSPPWSPRYYIRRAAWHVLDHAWEIEDRSAGPNDP
jgi:hypothetical protein